MATAKYKIGDHVQVLNEDHSYNSVKGKIERVKEDDKKETAYSIVSDDAKHSFDANEGDVQTLEIPKSETTARARSLRDKRRRSREDTERDIRNPVITESIAGNDNLDYEPNDPLTPPVPEPAPVSTGIGRESGLDYEPDDPRVPPVPDKAPVVTSDRGPKQATPLAPSPKPDRGNRSR